MDATPRSTTDRRNTKDRRQTPSDAYFAAGGMERRSGRERRTRSKNSSGWVQVNEWMSVWIDLGEPLPRP